MKVEILSTDCTERLGNRLWVLTQPFVFFVDDELFTVPQGFVTDGASVPRLLWPICSPVSGPFGHSALAHDFLYSVDGPDIGRLRADLVLYNMGRLRGAWIAEAQIVKSGVNLFGWMSYKKGRDKMTFSSCYNLVQARLRVAQLSGMQTTKAVCKRSAECTPER